MGDTVCGECVHLSQQYASAAESQIRFEGELQVALAEHKGEVATILTIAVKAARSATERAHRELKEHQLEAHGQADANSA